jgi:hypothetical protein
MAAISIGGISHEEKANEEATTGLIGSIVTNIQLFIKDFHHNRQDCPFVISVTDSCENYNSLTCRCNWEDCPLLNGGG